MEAMSLYTLQAEAEMYRGPEPRGWARLLLGDWTRLIRDPLDVMVAGAHALGYEYAGSSAHSPAGPVR